MEDLGEDAELARAREVLRTCERSLRRMIRRLDREPDAETPLKLENAIQSFSKSLFKVFDVEEQLKARGEAAGGGGRAALDLDAARAEVLERLARLAAGGGA